MIIHGGLNQSEDTFDDMWVLEGLNQDVNQ